MDVAPADGVAEGEFRYVGTEFGDCAGAFVSEAHVGVAVVFVGAAETRVGYFDEDFAALEGFGGG